MNLEQPAGDRFSESSMFWHVANREKAREFVQSARGIRCA